MLLPSSLLLTSVNILPIMVGVGLGWGEGIHLSVTIMFLFLPLTYVSLSCLQNRWKSRSKAVLTELKSFDADLMCIQVGPHCELSTNNYTQLFFVIVCLCDHIKYYLVFTVTLQNMLAFQAQFFFNKYSYIGFYSALNFCRE